MHTFMCATGIENSNPTISLPGGRLKRGRDEKTTTTAAGARLYDIDCKQRPVRAAYGRLVRQWRDILPAETCTSTRPRCSRALA